MRPILGVISRFEGGNGQGGWSPGATIPTGVVGLSIVYSQLEPGLYVYDIDTSGLTTLAAAVAAAAAMKSLVEQQWKANLDLIKQTWPANSLAFPWRGLLQVVTAIAITGLVASAIVSTGGAGAGVAIVLAA